MKTFTLLFLGVCLGFTVAQFVPHIKAAIEVKITGDGGVLDGYSVLSNGETICANPDVSTKLKTIDCD